MALLSLLCCCLLTTGFPKRVSDALPLPLCDFARTFCLRNFFHSKVVCRKAGNGMPCVMLSCNHLLTKFLQEKIGHVLCCDWKDMGYRRTDTCDGNTQFLCRMRLHLRRRQYPKDSNAIGFGWETATKLPAGIQARFKGKTNFISFCNQFKSVFSMAKQMKKTCSTLFYTLYCFTYCKHWQT